MSSSAFLPPSRSSRQRQVGRAPQVVRAGEISREIALVGDQREALVDDVEMAVENGYPGACRRRLLFHVSLLDFTRFLSGSFPPAHLLASQVSNLLCISSLKCSMSIPFIRIRSFMTGSRMALAELIDFHF